MLHELPLEAVCSRPDQPRRHFDPEAIQRLAESIRSHGQVVPALVRPNASGYELVHGERRWRACRIAGITTIRAEVQEMDDETAFVLSITENVQRNDLSPIEEAEAIRRLIDRFNYTQARIGSQLGRSQEWVSQRLALLRLPEAVQEQVIARAITPSVGSRLASIQNEERQVRLAKQAAQGNLRVRDLERQIQQENKPPKAAPVEPESSDGWLNAIISGDAKELAKRIPDGSVHLCFCDPVYERLEDYEWLAKECERVLVAGGSVIAQCGNLRRFQAECAMRQSTLQFVDLLAEVYPYALSPNFQLRVQYGWKPYLWFSKGPRRGDGWLMNRLSTTGKRASDASKELHPWGDADEFAKGVIAKLCEPGELVWDPFTGSGLVPAVCKQLGINYLASEIDAAKAASAQDRLAGIRRNTSAQKSFELADE